MIGDDVNHHSQPEAVGTIDEDVEVFEGTMDRVDVGVITDVVPVVVPRGWKKRSDPHGIDAEPGEILESAGNAGEIADPIAAGVGERPNVDLVANGTIS